MFPWNLLLISAIVIIYAQGIIVYATKIVQMSKSIALKLVNHISVQAKETIPTMLQLASIIIINYSVHISISQFLWVRRTVHAQKSLEPNKNARNLLNSTLYLPVYNLLWHLFLSVSLSPSPSVPLNFSLSNSVPHLMFCCHCCTMLQAAAYITIWI